MKIKVTDIIAITIVCLIPFDLLFALSGDLLSMKIAMAAVFQLAIVNFLLLGLKERDDRLIKKQKSVDTNK